MTPEEQESSDFLDDIADIVGDPSPIPPIGFAEINTYFKELYAEITYGTMTPEETYDAFTQRCEEILQKTINKIAAAPLLTFSVKAFLGETMEAKNIGPLVFTFLCFFSIHS